MLIEHSTDIARLKQEARSLQGAHKAWLDLEDGSDTLVITNATILTMETGKVERDLIKDGILVTRGGVIDFVGPASDHITVPARAQTIDAQGGQFQLHSSLPYISPFDFQALLFPVLLTFMPIGMGFLSDTPLSHGKWKLSLLMV